MPSPFPGMDPYLEDPNHWGNVHHGLISETQARLNAQLRPRYVVQVEERVYISPEDDPARKLFRVPDVQIARERRRHRAKRSGEPSLAVATAPVELTTMTPDEEVHEARLAIVDVASRSVVTVIEVMSPTNKVAGSAGRAEYLRKRQEVLNSPTHWVEIDLLRAGTPPVADRWGFNCDYLVHVSRAERRPKGLVWPIRLHEPLPVVTIPLRGRDADARLALQVVFTTAYERGAFDAPVDYRAEPAPPFAPGNRSRVESLYFRHQT
jgi:hypothetical protein